MPKRLQIYKCNACGNIVEVLYGGGGELVCCGEPMELLQAKTEDKGSEKHVPVIETNNEGIKVTVGSIPHPMEQEHFIEWIEVIADGTIHRKFLEPTKPPEAFFNIKGESIKAREHCNVHGLWKGEQP